MASCGDAVFNAFFDGEFSAGFFGDAAATGDFAGFVCFRVGISRRGERGIVGFKMDFGSITAI